MTRYGLIGRNLEHSFSPTYFNKKFAREGIADHSYKLLELDTLKGLMDEVSREGLAGFNVTIPFKEKIINQLDELDAVARKVGAVNTVKVHDGKLYGYNTDIYGFHESLKPFIKPDRKALILGTGGAAKAVGYVLRELNIEHRFVSRTPGFTNEIGYDNLDVFTIRDHQLIINTTPLGMYPYNEGFPPIPYHLITPEHVLYDLIYNPPETVFMKKGKDKGATVLNGQKMLELQAERSWEIWQAPGLEV